jgi:endonuclease/exonuclease/phosphatase (EEP) superfamily protein YafD
MYRRIRHYISRPRPRRTYSSVINSLSKVWKIFHVPDADSVLISGSPALQCLPTAPLRVTVWNLYKGHGGIQFFHDFRILCHRSDLLLTQEALLSAHGMSTYNHEGFQLIHAASYERADRVRDGVMTLCRSVPLDQPKRLLSRYPEPILQTPKAALITRFALAGTSDELLVVNLHSTLIRGRGAAVEEAQHLLGALPTHKGPIIVGGDFNTFTAGYLRAIGSTFAHIGLRLVPIPDDPRSAIGMLDQIFVRGLRVIEAIVDTTVKNSDHFPLRFKFELE